MTPNSIFKGYIFFILKDKGTKSEHYGPVLLSETAMYHLMHANDNPFSNDQLKPFHLSYCEISGTYDEKRNLITASIINKLDDPAILFWTAGNNETPTQVKLED